MEESAPRRPQRQETEICQSEKCAQKVPLPSSLLQTDELFELRARILAPIRVIEVLAGNTVVRRDDDVWYELSPGQQLQKLDSRAWDVNDRGESSSEAYSMRVIEHGNISALRDLFEVDHQILLESKPATPVHQSRSISQNQLNDQVTLFEVTRPQPYWRVDHDTYIGVANSNIRNGDWLCTFYSSNVTAVIRSYRSVRETRDAKDAKARYSFIGRAVVSCGEAGLYDKSTYDHSSRNWPPPDLPLGATIFEYNYSADTRPSDQKHETGVWDVGTGPPEDMKWPGSAIIPITLKEVQALTCPLKWSSYDKIGRSVNNEKGRRGK